MATLVPTATIKTRKDPFPTVRSAGLEPVVSEPAALCVHPDTYDPPPLTPRSLEKYRKNCKPGVETLHWGVKDDPITHQKKEMTFGIQSVKGVDVASTLKAQQLFGRQAYMQARGEKIYHSSTREPLGRGYERGHELPATVKEPAFPGFGIKQGPDEFDLAKKAIFPRGVEPESEDVRQQYIRSHSQWAPGEKAVRHYKWPEHIDENGHRFGLAEKMPETDGVKKAINRLAEPGYYPQTRVDVKASEDYKTVSHCEVGKSRNLGVGRLPVPDDFSFGASTGVDEVSAGQCVTGFYSAAEQLPDPDLGKNTKNVREPRKTAAPPMKLSNTRAFGVPSVRLDIARPLRRSVADVYNYGDEVGVDALVTPQRYATLGVSDDEFLLPREKGELKDILQGAGFVSEGAESDAEFERCHAGALEGFRLGPEDKMSLHQLLQVYAIETEAKVANDKEALAITHALTADTVTSMPV
uniref:EFHB C-terminal EF-hand domain-containing protein n=1 Tax=Chromera velia CCMP2878 TaxID=1169474 RepID=A0A0G4I4K9_9ALVE|eukprot:Cvel_10912.t1-p1 / transcript=Cvel_10912.t1 / gene=Cvel_10912 / organism=Chromera_velia_CCMP2878 / gene_product=EF-hand domain-containing family member B, putative / transcript_product=EF-hand domain-containing family member B, putative / location=Cvel_scaffold670:29749-35622(+) / protein_length=467 / sequence_SO=supercontig / SO=protein_coding / is_pseudo=false